MTANLSWLSQLMSVLHISQHHHPALERGNLSITYFRCGQWRPRLLCWGDAGAMLGQCWGYAALRIPRVFAVSLLITTKLLQGNAVDRETLMGLSNSTNSFEKQSWYTNYKQQQIKSSLPVFWRLWFTHRVQKSCFVFIFNDLRVKNAVFVFSKCCRTHKCNKIF